MASEERKAYMREYLKAYRATRKDEAAAYAAEYYRENIAKLREYAGNYRRENADAVAESKKNSRLKNIDHYRARSKEAAVRNSARIAEYLKVYRAQNKDKRREWYKNNTEKVNAAVASRRASKVRATPKWADPDAILEFYREAVFLSEITGELYTVDHIVPLVSKIVCGLHTAANLQVLSKSENSKKGNRHWPDMP